MVSLATKLGLAPSISGLDRDSTRWVIGGYKIQYNLHAWPRPTHLPSPILGYIELLDGLILPPTRCQYLILLLPNWTMESSFPMLGTLFVPYFLFGRLYGSRLIRTETPIDALDAGAGFEPTIFSSWGWWDNQTSLPCDIHYIIFSLFCQELFIFSRRDLDSNQDHLKPMLWVTKS